MVILVRSRTLVFQTSWMTVNTTSSRLAKVHKHSFDEERNILSAADNNPMLRDGVTGDWCAESGTVCQEANIAQDRYIHWSQRSMLASSSFFRCKHRSNCICRLFSVCLFQTVDVLGRTTLLTLDSIVKFGIPILVNASILYSMPISSVLSHFPAKINLRSSRQAVLRRNS